MKGCTDPRAVNYNPLATEADGSCIYLSKHEDICYAFKEAPSQGKDESFTMSYSFDGKDWVFFHDYIPDFYFHTKKDLFSVSNNKIYRHNSGTPGVYYDGIPKSFFVDMVVRSEQEFQLNSVQWMTEILSSQQEIEFSTLTHITIWNNQQCTGRIAISDVFDRLEYERRKLKGVWSFNEFRDMVAEYGTNFLKDVFNNYAVDETKIDLDKPWFNQDILHDVYFIIRLEFDNVSGKQVILHGADVNANISPR